MGTYTPANSTYIGRAGARGLGRPDQAGMPAYRLKTPTPPNGPSRYDIYGNPNVHGRIAEREEDRANPSPFEGIFEGIMGGGGSGQGQGGQTPAGVTQHARTLLNTSQAPGVMTTPGQRLELQQQLDDRTGAARAAGDVELQRAGASGGSEIEQALQKLKTSQALGGGDLMARLQELLLGMEGNRIGHLAGSLG